MDRILMLALGLLVVATLAVWTIVAGGFDMPENAGWVYHYQTLITGILAVVAGGGAVWAVLRQTSVQAQEAKDRRLRLARSYRAVMPDDLKTVMRYARRCAATQAFILNFVRGEDAGHVHGERDRQESDELPQRALDSFRSLVENFDDEQGELVADLIGGYQVQNSRFVQLVEDFNNPSRLNRTNLVTESWAATTIRSTVELYLRAEGMLPFARREITSIPIPAFGEDAINNAFNALEVDGILTAAQQNHIIRELSRGASQQ